MVHTHMRFLWTVCTVGVMYTPFRLSSPIFVTIFTFLGLCPPQMVHLLPVPNMEWAVYELCVVLALGTPQTARVR